MCYYAFHSRFSPFFHVIKSLLCIIMPFNSALIELMNYFTGLSFSHSTLIMMLQWKVPHNIKYLHVHNVSFSIIIGLHYCSPLYSHLYTIVCAVLHFTLCWWTHGHVLDMQNSAEKTLDFLHRSKMVILYCYVYEITIQS